MKKGANLYLLICTIASIFPFLAGFFCGIVNLFGDWTWLFVGHDNIYYWQPVFNKITYSFIVVLFTLLIIIILIKFLENIIVFKYKLSFVILLFLLTIMMRSFLLIVFYNEITPYHDFLDSWNRANGNMASVNHARLFPGYMNWSLILKIISFYSNHNYMMVLWFCIFCNGITAVFIYLLADEMFEKKNLALFSSLFFTCNPSSIVYALSSTPEHFAIACYIAAIFFLHKTLKNNSQSRKNFIYLLISGILCGLGNSVKTFSPIILIAYIIVLVIRELSGYHKKKYLILTLGILSLLLLQRAVTSTFTLITENIFDTKLDFKTATPWYLSVGLGREGEGTYAKGTYFKLYREDLWNGIPFDEAKRAAYSRIMNDWTGKLSEIPSFIAKKTIWAWQDDIIPFQYFQEKYMGIKCNTPIKTWIYEKVSTIGKSVSQIWYCISMLLGMVGCVMTIWKRELNNWGLLLLYLIIIGFSCLMMLSEVQSRYKCLVVPYICLVDANAVFTVCKSKTKE